VYQWAWRMVNGRAGANQYLAKSENGIRQKNSKWVLVEGEEGGGGGGRVEVDNGGGGGRRR